MVLNPLLLRPCDATNLNLSPLCNILSVNNDKEVKELINYVCMNTLLQCTHQPTMWGGVAKASYDPANMPDYASSILGPMRRYYISKEREDKELLSANVKVSDGSSLNME